jgi:uncharacterized protein with NRDE domain
MCLILFAYKFHPRYPLVLAGNRDEYYDRPTSTATFWEDVPQILAGRDLRCGGTWLGVTKKGKIAVLANHREPQGIQAGARSRGLLVGDILKDERPVNEYLEELRQTTDWYNGYSLIFGDVRELYYFSNRGALPLEIPPGIHGQSNDLLDVQWPKVSRGAEGLRRILSSGAAPKVEEIFELLADRRVVEDSLLPDTGIGLENERILSSIFVKGPLYGTRSSTLVLIDSKNMLTFVERTYNGNPHHHTTVKYRFELGTD